MIDKNVDRKEKTVQLVERERHCLEDLMPSLGCS